MSTGGRILLVGFGNMGQALVRGWLDGGRAAADLRVVEPAESARAVAHRLGVAASDSAAAALADFHADVVVLAVKPNQIGKALGECSAAAGAATV